jgi:hypothetical protein
LASVIIEIHNQEGRFVLKSDQQRRRGFLQRLLAVGGIAAAPVAARAQQQPAPAGQPVLPSYARVGNYKSLKQSSHDTTGGNADRWAIKPGATQEMADADARACAASAQAVSPVPRVQTTVMSSGAVVVTEPTQPVDAQRRMDEGQRMQECMRQKGYRLQAAP